MIINSDRDLKERLPHLAKEGESEDSDSQEGISVDCDLLTEEHTEAKDNDSNMYKCDLCNKVYVFRRSLTTHRKIHFGMVDDFKTIFVMLCFQSQNASSNVGSAVKDFFPQTC